MKTRQTVVNLIEIMDGRKPIIINRFICDLCDQTYAQKQKLRQHMEKVHLNDIIKQYPDSRRCRFCTLFVLVENFPEHDRQNHKRMKCDICKKVYFNVKLLYKHKKRHEVQYTCDICKRKLCDKKALKRHMMAIHSREAPLSKCEDCGKMLTDTALTNHINNIHKKQRKYQCAVCGKSFFNSVKLRGHLAAVHLKQKNHMCTICGRKFGYYWHLTRHYNGVHDGRKSMLKCGKCERTFGKMEILKKHLNLHKKRPFSCTRPLCRSMFATKEGRDKHVNEYKHCLIMFQCDKCDKKYKNRYNLEIHIMTKHLGLRYECHFCGERYVNKLTVKYHLMKHHVKGT